MSQNGCVGLQLHDTPCRTDASTVTPMFESLGERIVIIGNSGAGKSRLADALANFVRVPVIDLDLLHWEEDGYGRKRNEDAARQMTLEVSNQPRWIIEGVFGSLAEVALPKATGLIWLDLPWSLCRAGLLARGQRRGATVQDAADLMTWAEAYWTRQTPSSFAGHSKIFNDFSGTKFRLENREQIAQLLANLRAGPTA
jgi:adenylate kinase family enzyme